MKQYCDVALFILSSSLVKYENFFNKSILNMRDVILVANVSVLRCCFQSPVSSWSWTLKK